jgi:type I restriction enzyme S subunit
MAKKTKDSNLSIEERLEQALIPNWDEPYKLPPNWCWVKLSTVCSLENGEKYTEKDLVYLDAKTLRGVTEPQTRDSGIVVNKDQKVILVDGENSGEVFVVPYRGYMGSTFKILNIVTNADEMYIRYFVDQNRERLRNSKVGSAIPHLNKDLFFDLKLPFPPLSEQKRIVAHIETLFAKLDEAKKRAQEVIDDIETRKAAILHKAFTGELTAKWREERGVGMESWEKRRINELARPRAGYAFDSKKFSNTGYQVVRMGNLYGETLDLFRKPVFISEDDVDDSILNRALIKDGDILITLTGTKYKRDYGYAVCVSSPNKLLVNQRILCLTPFACVERNYLLYYLKSNLFRDVFFSCETGGVNQGNVSSKFVENIEIPIPTFDEQLEITTVLDRTLAHEQQAKEAAEAVLDQIELMKKSILARAFRGELGTNDPSEESAVELLRMILESK